MVLLLDFFIMTCSRIPNYIGANMEKNDKKM